MAWPYSSNFSGRTYGYNTIPDPNYYNNFPSYLSPSATSPSLSVPPSVPPVSVSGYPSPSPYPPPYTMTSTPSHYDSTYANSNLLPSYPSLAPQYTSEYNPSSPSPLPSAYSSSSSYLSYSSTNYPTVSSTSSPYQSPYNDPNLSSSTNNSNFYSSSTDNANTLNNNAIGVNPPSYTTTPYFSSAPSYAAAVPPPSSSSLTSTFPSSSTGSQYDPYSLPGYSSSLIPAAPSFSSSFISPSDSAASPSLPPSSFWPNSVSSSPSYTLPSTTIPTPLGMSTSSGVNISPYQYHGGNSIPVAIPLSSSTSSSFDSSSTPTTLSTQSAFLSTARITPTSSPMTSRTSPQTQSISTSLQPSTLSLNPSTTQSNFSVPLTDVKQKLLQERQELEKKKQELAEMRRQQEAQKRFLELQKMYLEQQKRKREMQRLKEEKERIEMERRQKELERRAREFEKIRQEQKKKQQQILEEERKKQQEEEQRKKQSSQSQLEEKSKRQQQQQEEEKRKERQLEEQREQQEKENARKEEEEKAELEVQMSFFSTLIETAKLIAQNCARLSSIINEHYQSVMIPGSEARNLMLDVMSHLELTLARLINMLANNVLNIEDNLHDSIKTAAAALNSTVKALITCVKNVTDTQQSSSLSNEQRSKQLRQHNVAVSYAIKTLIEELQKLKIAERLDPNAAKLLSASSIEEAEEISSAVVGTQQALEAMSKLQVSQDVAPPEPVRAKPPRPKRPPSSLQRPPTNRLSTYDVNKVVTLQRVIRQFLIRRRWKRLVEQFRASPESKNIRQRIRVMQEIIDTEKSYLQSLETAIKFFYEPLKAQANSSRPVASLEDVNTLFSSIEMIYHFTVELKNQLDERMRQWPSSQHIGDIFGQMAPMMKIYADYVNKFDMAMQVFKKLMQNKRFADFLKECQKKSGQKLDLPSFLIMPVQRMPRYQLLLKELLKYTPKEHVDWKNITDALDRITEVNMWINKKKQEQDNRMKILALEEMIKSPIPLVLVAPHRLFVRQGPLLCKRAGVDKDNISIILFMFNDMAVLTKQLKATAYDYLDKIMFQKTELKDLSNTTFMLIEDNNRQFTFTCSTPQEKAEWVKEIKETLQTLSLHTILNEHLNDTSIHDGFVILSATYGQINKPKKCIDVTDAIRKIVQEQGGNSLTLRAETKCKLPGFSDPSSKYQRKKNSLVIVYSVNGTVHTKTFRDNEAVYLDANTA